MFRFLLFSLFSSTALLSAAPQKPWSHPLVFEPNRGQASTPVRWMAQGSGYELFFTDEGVTVVIQEGSGDRSGNANSPGSLPSLGFRPPPSRPVYSTMQMKLIGSRPWKDLIGLEPTGGISNYIHDANGKDAHTNIPHYARVKAASVYPGIDLVFYRRGHDLEYDFVVAPRADPSQIRLAFEGQDGMRVDDQSGDLILTTPHGAVLRHHRPKVYQQVGDRQVEIAGGYQLQKGGRAAFTLAAYDHRRPLTIDPTVAFSDILGEHTLSSVPQANAIAVDSDGNSYVTGSTFDHFPVRQALEPSFHKCEEPSWIPPSGFCTPGTDAFVTKLSPSGDILFSTYLGGNDIDEGHGIAVDSTGVYVTGGTYSSDFPDTMSANRQGGKDAFITKLSLDGSKLIYSRIIGGARDETAYAIAVDSQHAVWITGETASLTFPVGRRDQRIDSAPVNGPSDMFYVKLGPAGESLVYGLLGGSGHDAGYGIAVNRNDNPWMTGGTCSPDFPATPGQQLSVGVCSVFVVKFTNLERSFTTIFGGSDLGDVGTAIAVDSTADMAYVTGYTRSANFPTTPGAYQPTRVSTGVQAFVTAIDEMGRIVHSTFLGDDSDTYGNGIALDGGRDIDVSLATMSRNFPGLGPTAPDPPLGVVVRLSRNLATLAHANYLGKTLTGVAVPPPIYGQSAATVVSGATENSAYVAKLYEDGVRDSILWHNETTGEVQIWYLNHAYAVTGTQTVAWRCGPQEGCPTNWKMVATGDLNGDGFGDVLLHNVTTGEVQAWLLNGSGGVVGTQSLSRLCGPGDGCSTNWRIVGIGDFNGDQHADVLWHNLGTGEVQAWLLDGKGSVSGQLTLVWKCGPAEGCPTNWRIVGVGDINQDGKDDVFLHNVTTGEVQSWLLNSLGGVIGYRTLGFRCDTASGCANQFSFVGGGDFNRDGLIDLLWYNSTTGDELAVLQDGASNTRGTQTLTKKCGPSDGCSPAWKPIGMLRDYHVTNP